MLCVCRASTEHTGRAPGLTHRRRLCEHALDTQVRAGEGGHHRQQEVEDGDDNGLNGANCGEETGASGGNGDCGAGEAEIPLMGTPMGIREDSQALCIQR